MLRGLDRSSWTFRLLFPSAPVGDILADDEYPLYNRSSASCNYLLAAATRVGSILYS